jgi:alpha-beta hydrolase superfamily lysophospholipase
MNVPAPVRSQSSYGVGVITAGEAMYLLSPHGRVDPADRKCIIALHGHGANALQFSVIGGWAGGQHVQNLAHNGYYVLSIDAGGATTWNNKKAMDAITAAYNYARTVLGIPGTRIALFGWSMGGGNSLQWFKENPAKVCGAYVWAPMTNLTTFHNDPTRTAEIDAAYAPPSSVSGYSSGDYSTNAVGHKISGDGNFAPWQTGIPIHVAHGDADTTVALSQSQAFVTGCGIAQVTLSVLAGGTHGSIFGLVLPNDTLAFYNSLNWAAP